MNKYRFTAYSNKGRLHTHSIVSASLPSHVDICLQILQKDPEATRYTMIGSQGKELLFTPIELNRYISHEFVAFMKQTNYSWVGKHIEYDKGFHKGEKGEILAFHRDRQIGSFFSVLMESGAYENIDIHSIKNIKLI